MVDIKVATALMNFDSAKLRRFIQNHFSVDELETLLFDYFRPVYDDISPAMPKQQKVRLLLDHCIRHGRLADLVAALGRERPAIFNAAEYGAGQEAILEPITPPPARRNPRQVFISHAHQDAEMARRLAHDLEAEGYAIWIAPDSIRPGEKWAEAIGRGLDSSGLFLLLMSPEAVASKWVNTETNIAIELNHEGEMQLYPLLLRACRVPALWRAYQRISLRGGYDDALRQLLAALTPTNHDVGAGFKPFAPTNAILTKIPTRYGKKYLYERHTKS